MRNLCASHPKVSSASPYLASWLLAIVLGTASDVAAQTPLRVMTLNVEILTAPGVRGGVLQKYRWDVARRAQFERTAAMIEALAPDVFNLLEATSREAVDLLVKILHEKGLTEYQGFHVESNDAYTGMDVSAIVRRYVPDKIDGKSIRTFYSPNDDPLWRQTYKVIGPSGATSHRNASLQRNGCYLLTIGGHRLGFLGLHLKADPDDEDANAQRTAQAAIVQRIVRQEIVGRGYLPIVLGDLNDYDPEVPDRDEERETKTTVLADIKNYDNTTPGPELFNVASKIVRQADRFTSHWDRNENDAEDPYDVFTMIDHILIPVEFESYVQRAFIFHNLDGRTTDHRAVVVDLLLP